MRPTLVLLAAAALGAAPFALAHQLPPEGDEAACGGEAPGLVGCSTGTHHAGLAGGPPVLTFTFGGDPYTGTLESKLLPLLPMGMPRAERCDVFQGFVVACTSRGDAPLPFVPFEHVCESQVFGTNAPGGSGDWSCRLAHGVV